MFIRPSALKKDAGTCQQKIKALKMPNHQHQQQMQTHAANGKKHRNKSRNIVTEIEKSEYTDGFLYFSVAKLFLFGFTLNWLLEAYTRQFTIHIKH